MRQSLTVSWLVFAVLSVLILDADGHGVMIHPPSRNWNEYLLKGYNYPHGLAAGGVRKTSDKGRMQWPRGRRGYCGDAYDELKWDLPGPIQAVYRAGQTITIDAVVAVNHLGRFDMWVCPVDAKVGEGKCIALERADGKGMYWYLPFLTKWGGGNAGYDKPAYSDGSFSFYTLPTIDESVGCKSQRLCNMFVKQVVYRTEWELPKGFTCEHCKLQWHYLTGHRCWPPCAMTNKDEPTCFDNQVYQSCGKPGAAYPEEFWNCADIRITDAARAATAEPAPQWAGRISDLVTGKFGTPRVIQMSGRRRQLLAGAANVNATATSGDGSSLGSHADCRQYPPMEYEAYELENLRQN